MERQASYQNYIHCNLFIIMITTMKENSSEQVARERQPREKKVKDH